MLVGYDLERFSSWARLFLGLVLIFAVLKIGRIGPSTVLPQNTPSPTLTIVEVSSNPTLRMRPPKTDEHIEMEVGELKVEAPVESASISTTAAHSSGAVVVVENASVSSTVPDLEEEDDEDALFEKISATAARI